MNRINSIKFTVFFQDPFWVGVFERQDENGYAVAKTVFGAEPTDPELLLFLLHQYNDLRFTTPDQNIASELKEYTNPKRQLREVRKMLRKQPKSRMSKAQDALRIEQEKNKLSRKTTNAKQRRAEEKEQFDRKQEKKKQKLRGH